MDAIKKTDLRLGNMFEQGIVFKISGRAGAKVHLHGKGKWYKGFRTEVDASQLKPIKVTETVVLEWLSFERATDSYWGFLSPRFGENNSRLRIDAEAVGFPECKWYGRDPNGQKIYFGGLHDLQNWYYFNTNKKELEIKE